MNTSALLQKALVRRGQSIARNIKRELVDLSEQQGRAGCLRSKYRLQRAIL